MDIQQARFWQRLIRDSLLSCIGSFMLIYETVAVASPSPVIVSAGLVALGLPLGLRIDEWIVGEQPRR